MFGTQELLIVLVIVLVIFGAKRLPELGSGIGQAIKNFKKATSEPEEIEVPPATPEKSQAELEKAPGQEPVSAEKSTTKTAEKV